MANNKAGAAKAVETMRRRYGDDFFKRRAARAGRSKTGRFKKGSQDAQKEGLKGVAKRWKQSNGGSTS